MKVNYVFGSGVVKYLIMLLLCVQGVNAQIYRHSFGTTTINAHPYTVAPDVLNTNLSGSSWSNSNNAWSSNAGATGQAITLAGNTGTSTINLSVTIANNFQANITSFNFWRLRSNSGHQNWSMAINGITVGSGTVNTTGAAIGVTPVANAVSGLTGTIAVTITLTGGNGGNFRLDDFTLNGTVTSSCNSVAVTNFTPVSGPANTIITINGSGFNNTASVAIGGVNAPGYTIVSDTQLQVAVPAVVTLGTVLVTATDGCSSVSTASFSAFQSGCNSGSDIYISELYDQRTGSGGMIELYNPTNATISLTNYTLQRYGNINDPAPTPGYILQLTGSLPPGQAYLIAGSSPNQSICFTPPFFETIGSGFNGNDKFELLKNGVLIDVINVPFTGPGFTLIRNPDAVAPAAVYNITDWDNLQHDTTELPSYCSDLGSHTVTPIVAPTITQPVPQTICQNGTAIFSVAVSGTEAYTYQWKILTPTGTWVNVVNNGTYSGATTNTLNINNVPLNFNGNQYYCEITSDDCNISSNATQLTVSTPPPAPTVTDLQPTCTTPTGTLTVTAPTDVGTTYKINSLPYQASPIFAGLSPGSYNVVAKNAAGCESAITIKVINPAPAAPVAPTVTDLQPTCTTPTGTLTVTDPTDAGTTYKINNLPYQASPIFAGLAPGSYNVVAKNAAGCESAITVKVINPAPAAPVAPTVTDLQPTCTTPTGTLTVTAPTDAGTTYKINNLPYQASPIFAGLAPGSYNVVAKNAAGCESAITVKVINPAPAAPAAPTVTDLQPTCTTPTGTLTVTAPTDAGTTYKINNLPYQASPIFAGLPPGSYNVVAKNAAGCESAITIKVINPAPAAPVAPTVTDLQPTCTTPTGTLTVTDPTDAGTIYKINNLPYQNSPIFAGLAPGSYNVVAKNAAGCESAITVKVINPAPAAPPAPTVTDLQPTCTTPTGTLTVTAPTDAGTTYKINNLPYQVSPIFAGLPPGSYDVVAKNAAGCESAITVKVINPAPAAPVAPTVTDLQPTCTTPTGTLTVTAPTDAGTTYKINSLPYQNSPIFAGLPPGSYNVVAKNAAGCESAITVKVINPAPAAPVAPTVTDLQPTCTTPTGTLTVTAPTDAGTTYKINSLPYQASPIFAGLSPGSYNVVAKNAAGCESAITVKVINPAPAAPATPNPITGSDSLCEGSTIQLSDTTTGGIWSSDNSAIASVDTNGVVTAVSPGSVTIRYTIGTVCTASASKVITVAPLPDPVLKDAFLCIDTETGLVSGNVVLSSNLPASAYTFQWYKEGVLVTNTSSALPVNQPGSYRVTATNVATGCTGSATATVGLSSLAVAVAEVGNDFSRNQTIRIQVTGGSGSYEYSLNNEDFQDEPAFSGILEGEYTIYVKDKNGCGTAQLEVFALNYPTYFTPNGDTFNDTWNIKGLRDQKGSVIYIFDRFGKIITSIRPGYAGWDGTYNGERLPATDYWFTLSYTSSNGNNKEFKAHFSLKR